MRFLLRSFPHTRPPITVLIAQFIAHSLIWPLIYTALIAQVAALTRLLPDTVFTAQFSAHTATNKYGAYCAVFRTHTRPPIAVIIMYFPAHPHTAINKTAQVRPYTRTNYFPHPHTAADKYSSYCTVYGTHTRPLLNAVLTAQFSAPAYGL